MIEKEHIYHTIAPSFLGPVLVAKSVHGICAVLIGDDPEVLKTDLQKRFPESLLVQDDLNLHSVALGIAAHMLNPCGNLNIDLDVRGTTFQMRVWSLLQKIPAGEIISYTQIAKNLGFTNAVRAVAGACAANKIAVLIPCHRVVKSDGGLSGYRWGVERKEKLLRLERALRSDIRVA